MKDYLRVTAPFGGIITERKVVPKPSLFVPPSAIVTTTERTFVIRARVGKAEWVNPPWRAVRRATDELRSGAAVRPRTT